MTKKLTKTKQKQMVMNSLRRQFLRNTSTLLTRSALISQLDQERNINYECQYPDNITKEQYQKMYDREAVAKRVVHLFPDKCWSEFPEIQENDNPEETTFEKEWNSLVDEKRIFHYLHRIDTLSGVGEFGVLLLGINDGKSLNEPVEGIDEVTGKRSGNKNYELLYLKPFNQSVVEVKTKEKDPASPRYGLPKTYDIIFEDTQTNQVESNKTVTVHWTRVIHIADNRAVSDVYGIPRMKSNYNRIVDIQKISSGSGEMFWKGGYQGFSIETIPDFDIDMSDDDITALKTQLEDYNNGLQRNLYLQNMTAKSMAPQVESPKDHIDVQLTLIAIDLGVPRRMMMGSEEAKLASEQDTKNFNGTIASRREYYVSPLIIRPVIDRLIDYGVLTEVEEYTIIWNDLDTPTDEDKANVAKIKTEALAKYVQADVVELIPPEEFLSMFLEMTTEQIEIIKKSSILWETLGESDDNNSDDGNNDNINQKE